MSKVWHEGLKPSNVVSGFRTTGIFPVDKEKCKKSRLDRGCLSDMRTGYS